MARDMVSASHFRDDAVTSYRLLLDDWSIFMVWCDDYIVVEAERSWWARSTGQFIYRYWCSQCARRLLGSRLYRVVAIGLPRLSHKYSHNTVAVMMARYYIIIRVMMTDCYCSATPGRHDGCYEFTCAKIRPHIQVVYHYTRSRWWLPAKPEGRIISPISSLMA